MRQLNIAANFAAATVLTIFVLTCWYFDGRPFESPAKAVKAVETAAVARQSDSFGGKFGVRGPDPVDEPARSRDGRVVLEGWTTTKVLAR